MTEPTADDLARWAEEHRRFALPDGSEWCVEDDIEWPCMTARLLALVAAQADQIAGLRADERAVKRVRALCDEAEVRHDACDELCEGDDLPCDAAGVTYLLRPELFRAALDGTEATP